MDRSPLDSQNPYASPRENIAKSVISQNLQSLAESPICYSGIVQPEEVTAAYALAIRGSWRAVCIWIARVIVCIFYAFLLICASIGLFHDNLVLAVFSLTMFAAFLGTFFLRRVILKIKLGDMQRKHLGFYQFTEGIIREDGFEVKTEDGASFIKWSTFKGLRQCESAAILFYAKHRGYCFFGRSKFKNEADWQRLIRFLEGRFPIGKM
jgi:hypothetical protein